MTSSGASSPAERAEARSRRKRLWWLLLAFNPFWTTWVAFLYAGLRVKKKEWLVFAAAYAAVELTGFAIIQGDASWQENVGALLTFIPWLVGIPHALTIRGEYLDRREVLDDPRLRDARRLELRRSMAGELARGNPELARDSRMLGSDLVDINHASVEELASLPGVDRRLARKIVHMRDEVGGFSSVYDLGHLLDLEAPLVDGIAPRVVCLPR
jgi:Helix-hairpin-helix motif